MSRRSAAGTYWGSGTILVEQPAGRRNTNKASGRRIENREWQPSIFSFSHCFYQRVKQNHLALCPRRKVVRSPFRDMADRSRPQSDPAPVDAQTPASSENVTEDILISVFDLLRIRTLSRPE